MKHRFAHPMAVAVWIGAAVLAPGTVAPALAGPDEADTVKPDRGPIALAPGLSLTLPSLHALNHSIEVVQSVAAHYGSQTIAFEGRIDAGPDHFTMVCSDGLGRRAVTVQWTESGVRYEAAPWVPKQLRPQNMLADLVMIYWPQEALAKALPDATVTTTATGRRIAKDGKDVVAVDYTPQSGPDGADIWLGKTVYHNRIWNYNLVIESAALEP